MYRRTAMRTGGEKQRNRGTSPAPLSFTQQRIWTHFQRDPDSMLWRTVIAFRLKGALTPDQILAAFHGILDRHQLLRCSFQASADGSALCVARDATPVLTTEDMTSVDEEELDSELQWYLSDALQEPLDISAGPSLALHLLELAANEQILISILHPLVCDASSAEVLREELETFLTHPAREAADLLQTIEKDYADHAQWQRQQMANGVWVLQERSWLKLLTGAPVSLPLPADLAQRGPRRHEGASVRCSLPSALTARLKAVARSLGLEERTLYLTAYHSILHLFTDLEDVIVALRDCCGPHYLIGPLASYWPTRLHFEPDNTFGALLSRMQTMLDEFSDNRDLPCDRIWGLLSGDDQPRWPAPLNVCFSLQRDANVAHGTESIRVEPMDIVQLVCPFEWELRVTVLADGQVDLNLVYDSSLFHRDTIRQALSLYQALLRSAAENHERSILNMVRIEDGVIDRPDPRKLGMAAVSSSASRGFISLDQSVAARFEQVVRNGPSRAALDDGKQILTYGDLNRRANGIAVVLRHHYVQGTRQVALLFSRGQAAIPAMLGALKAGVTYIPMDSSHPMNRLRLVAADCGARVIVTTSQDRNLALDLGFSPESIICADITAALAAGPELAQPVPSDADAYILYTSGSTGIPKGVVQRHKNILHFIRAYSEGLGISSEDRLTLLASYSVDAAVMDIYGALLNGATLCPLPTAHGGFAELTPHLVRQRITIFHSTPTVFRYLMETLGDRNRLQDLRLVIMGGEAVLRSDFEAFNQHFKPGCCFVNWLGSTESSLTLQYVLHHGDNLRRSTVPIGYPVIATDVVLLNRHGKEGAIYGELAVRSEHVAIEYWHQPEASAEVFTAGAPLGRRTYRSGDMVRRLADGSFEYLGRRDFQVKIRGYRVELGEVEVALGTHDQIARCAVVAAEDDSRTVSLKAFYEVSEGASAPNGELLHRFLASHLPSYMVPSVFLPLKRLPLTASGKIDRSRLAAGTLESELQA